MNKLTSSLKSMNKWQAVVLLVVIGVMIWLLIQQYLLKPVCLNAMCPSTDPTLWPRLGFLAICAVLAIWLLKTPKNKAE